MTERSRHEGEARVIAATKDGPVTRGRIEADLRALGVRPGMTLLVHSSLSSLGWVVGGATTVALRLEAALDPGGTLLMPAFSHDAPDPEEWEDPSVPES